MPVRALLLFVVVLGLLVGCSGNQRKDTIRATLVAFNAARVGFLEWDDRHQGEIVAKVEAKTLKPEEGRKELAAYREARDGITQVIISALNALSLAATQDDGPSLDAALAEVAKFYKALKALKGE